MFCHIIRGDAKAVNICAEDGTADKISFKCPGKEIKILHNSVLIDLDHFDLRDHRRVKPFIRAGPAALGGRIQEENAGISLCGDLRQPAFSGESHCLFHALPFFFKYQKQRRTETIVVYLPVQVIIRNKYFQIKCFKPVLPAFSAGYIINRGPFHHSHK